MQPSVSAVHRGLLISEVFRVIAAWLCTSDSKKTLVSLGMTCRTMEEASMAMLWETLSGPMPLLHLLPANVWSEVPDPKYGTLQLEVTKPENLEWTRFKRYAQHVRHFSWLRPERVSSNVLTALAKHLPAGQPLIPKLHTLIWDESRSETFGLHLFLTPAIRHVELTLRNGDPSKLMSLLTQMDAVRKTLTYLKMTIGTSREGEMKCTGPLSDALARFLSSMPELKDFYCAIWSLSAGCVEALAALPKLAKLTLYVGEQDKHAWIASAASHTRSGAHWFRALKYLGLYTEQMDRGITAFLAAVQSDHLQELLVRVSHPPAGYHGLKQELGILGSQCPYRDSLATVEITFRRPSAYGSSNTSTDQSLLNLLDVEYVLQLFYVFPRIRKFTTIGWALYAGGKSLPRLANAWPELESLTMYGYSVPESFMEGHTGNIVLEDLARIPRLLPRLRTLELQVDASVVPDAQTVARLLPEPSQSPLRSLIARNALITDADQVASFLARVFPELEQVAYARMVGYLGSQGATIGEKWSKVESIFKDKMGASEHASSDKFNSK
ncbi:uncharacterized protein TRAVEDRAFT_66087 [Trametes versicolor FP-101664 SS1]|uniref:uncharacterized protein n=1 Tax=Trametes versicolor (strain FP-101664) TaxID=717944 RepID=UPI0004621395|nr:uncharacterized protein TRAVEDRAFT_66087 [Trametes versicolor FP-101664 SS1]EIW55795.1 hypothetical protein TRAVEDRAFT_66087 [Trametes versicolor FP-101664 SS1]